MKREPRRKRVLTVSNLSPKDFLCLHAKVQELIAYLGIEATIKPLPQHHYWSDFNFVDAQKRIDAGATNKELAAHFRVDYTLITRYLRQKRLRRRRALCATCKQEFEPRNNQKYCSAICQQNKPRLCPTCKREFVPTRNRQVACSKECLLALM